MIHVGSANQAVCAAKLIDMISILQKNWRTYMLVCAEVNYISAKVFGIFR